MADILLAASEPVKNRQHRWRRPGPQAARDGNVPAPVAQDCFAKIGCQGLCAQRRKLHGADTAASSSGAKTKLVEAKLEMVRAAWLFQHSDVVRRFCRVNRPDRIQRNEIERRL